MFKHILTLFIVAATGFALQGQGIATWLETEHDFGVFSEELKEVTCAMRLVNTGDAPLVITRAQASCGCTAVDYPRTPIAPGDTAAVAITFNARNRVGNFDKDVFVYTNGTPRRSILKVYGRIIGTTATVRAKYPFETGPVMLDRKAIPMGEIMDGKAVTKYFHGYNTGLDTVLVTFGKLPPHLRVSILPTDTLAPGDTFTATVTYDATSVQRRGFGTDTITFSAIPPVPSAMPSTTNIEVMAVQREDFSLLTAAQLERAPVASLSTTMIDFDISAPNDPVERTFTITNNGKEPLIVRRLFIPDEHISATIPRTKIKPHKRATVTVTLDAPKCHDSIVNTTLEVITNDPHNPVQTLRVVGQVKVGSIN